MEQHSPISTHFISCVACVEPLCYCHSTTGKHKNFGACTYKNNARCNIKCPPSERTNVPTRDIYDTRHKRDNENTWTESKGENVWQTPNGNMFNAKKMRPTRARPTQMPPGVWWRQQKPLNRKHIAGGDSTKCFSAKRSFIFGSGDSGGSGCCNDDRSSLSLPLILHSNCDSSSNMTPTRQHLIHFFHFTFAEILFVPLIAAFILCRALHP